MPSSQPAGAVAARVAEIAAAHAGREGPLLPILHDVQAAFGHVPAAAVPVLAAALNVTKAEVHGVVSFYHDFRSEPAGRHVLRLCRAEACQATGGEALAAAARARLGVDWGGTARGVTLEPVFCLGLCACGPAAMLDGLPVGRLDAAALEAMLAECGA
jgi:formate dehydrogenase subunit gamma